MINPANFFATTDTPLATALLTAGVQGALIDEKRRFVYREFGHGDKCDDAPLQRDRHGRPTTPGRITLFLDQKADGGLGSAELAKAFHDQEADLKLDEYIATLPEPYRETLQKMLPLAYMAYGNAFSQNRKAVLKAINESEPFLRLKRPDGNFQLIRAKRWEAASTAEKARILNA